MSLFNPPTSPLPGHPPSCCFPSSYTEPPSLPWRPMLWLMPRYPIILRVVSSSEKQPSLALLCELVTPPRVSPLMLYYSTFMPSPFLSTSVPHQTETTMRAGPLNLSPGLTFIQEARGKSLLEDRWTAEWKNGWLDGWMSGCVSVQRDGQMSCLGVTPDSSGRGCLYF